jgi:hypothetical protein
MPKRGSSCYRTPATHNLAVGLPLGAYLSFHR